MSSTGDVKLTYSFREVLVERLSENAVVPTKMSELAAGYDLYSAHDCRIPSLGKKLVSGLDME